MNPPRETTRRAGPKELVPEVTFAGEHHRHAGFVGGVDDFLVAYRPTWLNDRCASGFYGGVKSVAERKEGVAGTCATLSASGRFLGRDSGCVTTILLTRSYSTAC